MKKNKNIALSIGIFIFVVMYKLYLLNMGNVDFRDSLTAIFGYINLNNEKSFIINFSSWVMPQLTVVLLYGEYYKRELVANSSLILIRSSSRTKIMLKYVFELIKKASIVVMLEIIVSCVFSLIRGKNLDINMVLFLEIISIFIYMLMFILMINALCLYINTTYAVCIAILFEIIQVFIISKNIMGSHLLPVYGILYEIAGDSVQAVLPLVFNNVIWIVIVSITTLIIFKKKRDII